MSRSPMLALVPVMLLGAFAAACDRTPTNPDLQPPSPGQGAPAVSAVTPAIGSADGGTEVVITGTVLQNVLSIMFGDRPAVTYFLESETAIRALSPSGSPEGDPVHVVVRTIGGTSPVNDAARFQWDANTLTDLALSSSIVAPGSAITGTVTVTYPAPGAGVRLPLRWSSTPSGSTAILLPQTVLVPPGALTGSFQVTTFFVSSPHQFEISSEHWGETRSASFTVTP